MVQGELATSLNTHSKTIASKSGLPVFHFDETKQVGHNFGTRFSNAIQYVFDKGYDGIITFGNDCPHLELNHIHRAKAMLDQGGTVLGPTYDGGFYLMGLAKKDFEYASFLQLPWNTNTLFEDFFKNLQARGIDCHTLEKLCDIDYLSALNDLVLHRIQNIQLRNSIQIALQKPTTYHFVSKSKAPRPFFSSHFNKGSPILFSIRL